MLVADGIPAQLADRHTVIADDTFALNTSVFLLSCTEGFLAKSTDPSVFCTDLQPASMTFPQAVAASHPPAYRTRHHCGGTYHFPT